MTLPDPDRLSRRKYLRRLVAVGGTAALAACLDSTERAGDSDEGERVPTGDPGERPDSQHAWNAALTADDDGNLLPPEHHVLCALELRTDPDESAREQVEDTFESLERAYAYDVEGLLFTVSYTPAYFETVGVESPLPEPESLTSLESGGLDFDTFDALVHLASNSASVVLEAEEALFGEVAEPNGVEMTADLTGVFERVEPRRTGFVGDGLPREMAEEAGVDVPEELPEDAPFFMGFRSGFAESQAPESRVTIQQGPYEGGSTAHVETLDLQLRTWFQQDDHFLRVAQMFSPEHATEELVGETGERLGTSTGVVGTIADRTAQDARSEGVVGHAQKAARGRDDDGTPPLLRRDFNTLDGDRPGVHFLSHQRTISDFVRVREAMTGGDVAGQGVGQRHNNGILQYIFVDRRGNYLTPPRRLRALPEEES